MNRQDTKKGRGIEWTSPYGRRGYTWNPIKGCEHACAWRMPNGERAQCYAKSVAEGLAQAAYPQGFSHLRFDDTELMRVFNLKEPSGIFADSMSDMLGLNVSNDWTERVIEVMALNRQHIFFVLTKNPTRLTDFSWPDNVWLGVSAPPTYMHKGAQMGCDLTTSEGRLKWHHYALRFLSRADAAIKWTSIEPLSDDFSPVLKDFCCDLDWAVIGAASNGRETIQPDEQHFVNVLNTLDSLSIPVFFKGNISKKLAARHGGWREDFPFYEAPEQVISPVDEAPKPQQMSLL